jgi:hypothetical protein
MFFVLKSSPSSPIVLGIPISLVLSQFQVFLAFLSSHSFGYSHFSRSFTVPGFSISLVLPQSRFFGACSFSHSFGYSHFSRSFTVPGFSISLVLPQSRFFGACSFSHSPGFSGLSRSPVVLVGSQPCPKTYVLPSLTLGTGRLAQGGYPLKKPPIQSQLGH